MAEGVFASDLEPVSKANDDATFKNLTSDKVYEENPRKMVDAQATIEKVNGENGLVGAQAMIEKVNGEIHCKYPKVSFSRAPIEIKDNSKDMDMEKIDNNDNVVKDDGYVGLQERAEKFVPRPDLVDKIMELGICRNAAITALFFTRNHSVVLASNYILDMPTRAADISLKERVHDIMDQHRKHQQAKKMMEDRIVDTAVQNYKRVHQEDREFAAMMALHNHHHPQKHHVTEMGDAPRNQGVRPSMQDTDESDENEMDEEEMMEDIGVEYKVVLVVNVGVGMNTGLMAEQTAKAILGLSKVIMKIPFTSLLGPEEFSMWEDLDERMETLRVDTDEHLINLELMAENLKLPNYTEMVLKEKMARRTVFAVFGSDDDVDQVTGRLRNMDSSP